MFKKLYDNYAVTGLVLTYYMGLLGFGTYQIFTDITAVTDAATRAYLGLLGLPAAAIAFFKWRMDRDE